MAPLIAAIVMATLVVPAASAAAVPPDTPIVIDGGGWGHNIGMPQWAARGQAEHDGMTFDEILAYWYQGTGLNAVSNLTGNPVPSEIRVGINYVLVGTERQYRPFRWQDFSAVNGPVSICLPGETEGACSVTAAPGESWRFRWFDTDGGFCVLTRGSTVIYQHATECDVSLYWTDQPNTRVSFPGGDVARTFARGHIDFITPVTVNGSTGFHFNVVLSLEEYSYGLAEMPVSWHSEALKSQAVAARTYAAWKAKRGVRTDCSCHLVWDTADQSYRGWHTLNEGNATDGARWKAAVDDTAAQVVVYPAGTGDIAETYYFSSSGGATENVWEVWGPGTTEYRNRYAYLATQPDPWSVLYATTPTESTTIRWRYTRTASQIVSALSGGTAPAFPGLTELHSIEIVANNASGSPSDIEVTGIVNGVVTSKHFVSRAPTAQQGTIATLVSRLGLRGHFIYSFTFPEPAEPERWSGPDRYGTAAAVSQQTHPGGADIVYLTVGTNHPDAIAAGPAAAAEGAPILLVTPTGLPEETRLELQRLDPSQVVIVGGDAAISEGVVSEVATALPAAQLVRRAGPSRYETAVEVSKAAFPGGAATVFVATGEDFTDAVVAAPAAIHLGGPLLLVPASGVPTAVRDEITRLGPSRIVVVGGASAISDAAFSELNGLAPTVERISGPDRYAISAAVSATFFSPGSTAFIAVGTAFPDALAAGPATAASSGPVLLVQADAIPAAIAAELTRLAPRRMVILGGTAAVGAAVEAELAGFVQL